MPKAKTSLNDCYVKPTIKCLGSIEELTEAKPSGKKGKGRDGGRQPRTKMAKTSSPGKQKRWYEKHKKSDDIK